MLKVYYLLFCLTYLTLSPIQAQEPSQPARIQLFFERDTQVEVLSVPDSSLLVYSKKRDVWGNKANFGIVKYNANLQQVWSKTLDIAPESEYLRHFTEMPYTYFAFSGRKPSEYKFVRINIFTGEAKLTEVVLNNIDGIYDYGVILGKYFIIGNNSKDGNPLFLYLNPEDKEPQILPTIYDERTTFSDLLIDTKHNRVDVVLSESNKRISRLQVKSFDIYGKLISNHFILQQGDKSLLNAEISPGDSTTKLLFGTYGTRDIRYGQGFFVADVTSGIASADFYNALQLKNFYKYMKPRREKRVRSREAARLKAGKDPLNRFRFLIHDLITTPEGYFFATEVYYPQTRSSSLGPTVLAPSPIRREEGFRRTHLVVLAFDKDGNLLWDNNFSLEKIITPTLTHAVEIAYTSNGKIIIAYPEENKIIYRIMQNEKYIDEHTEIELLRSRDNEKMKFTSEQGVIRWYGSNFVAFGFTSKDDKGFSDDRVFYINKISF